MTTTLDSVKKVDIDPSGVFKYILMEVQDKKNRDLEPIIIVRGYQRCMYHSDIYDEVAEKLLPLDSEVKGGGRIAHDRESKRIRIYGYSQGFGRADHELTAKLIKEAYPNYSVVITDEEY